MTTMTIDAKTTAIQTVLERSVCLLLKCGGVGNQRKVELSGLTLKKGEETVEQPKGELGANKRLFDTNDLKPCNHTIGAAKEYLRSVDRALAGRRVFGDSTYLVAIALIGEVEARLTQFKTDLAEHADALAHRLPDLIDARREKLGPFFNLGDYPTADEIRADYSIDWSYVSFAAPERLESVDRAVFEAAQAKYQGKLADAYDEVVVGLRQAALTVMQELARKLGADETGKPKALRPEALKDLQDLLGRLPVLNITDDDALTAAVAKVGAIAQHLDVDVLKKAPGVRAMLLEAAEGATARLDELVLTGRRAISFGRPAA